MIDIGLEQGSGVALARRLAKAEPDLGVLIYTGLEDEALLRDALHSGARGFALKADPLATWWRRPARSRPGAATSILISPRAGRGAPGEVAPLSPRERQVMAPLAGSQGPPGAERLHISPDTVRTHVENAMNKLDARTGCTRSPSPCATGSSESPIRRIDRGPARGHPYWPVRSAGDATPIERPVLRIV